MKPKLILITTSMLFTFTCLQNVKAQSKITGIVQNVDGKPISGASILLLHPADSSLVKGTTSSADGSFSLNKISPGNYLVQCSNIGNKDHHSKPFSVDTGTINLGFIKLAQQTGELKGVTVTTRKPMFEQKIDRMVVNVKNSITSAGGTVLEVLEKSPGVIVNRSTGAVSMNGKDGVMIMINGKINYMPQDAVLQMLNGINASNVEKIELITTPPAQYDAGGNAGYINIVLINNPNEGFNGSYSLSIGVGKGTFPSANTNFNYRKKNSNIYGSYSFSRLAVEQIFQNYRRVTNNSVTNEISNDYPQLDTGFIPRKR